MPADAHAQNEAIELPYFNTPEFFGELSGRVCDRFDSLLAESGV